MKDPRAEADHLLIALSWWNSMTPGQQVSFIERISKLSTPVRQYFWIKLTYDYGRDAYKQVRTLYKETIQKRLPEAGS